MKMVSCSHCFDAIDIQDATLLDAGGVEARPTYQCSNREHCEAERQAMDEHSAASEAEEAREAEERDQAHAARLRSRIGAQGLALKESNEAEAARRVRASWAK